MGSKSYNIGEAIIDTIANMKIPKNYETAINVFKKRVMEKYSDKIEKIVLFGSVARGEETDSSDADILVVWNGDKVEGWNLLEEVAFRILMDTKEFISLKVLTPVEFEDLRLRKNPFIMNLLDEGVSIV